MTKQEVFDKVATHLLKQGEKAEYSTEFGEPICAYRTSEGLKCAVGCLIPDDLYEERLENLPAAAFVLPRGEHMDRFNDASVALEVGKKIGLTSEHMSILGSLQNIHDVYITKNWRTVLQELAENYNLDAGVCDA